MYFLNIIPILVVFLLPNFTPLSLSHTEGIFLPFYADPVLSEADWTRLKTTAFQNPKIPFMAVINPNSGPGNTKLDYYYKAIDNGVPPNLKFLGFVDTLNTTLFPKYLFRDKVVVQGEIDRWYEWYGDKLSGIFLTASNRWTGLGGEVIESEYYGNISSYIRTKSGLGQQVALNPVVPCWEEYYNIADYIVIFQQDIQMWTGDANGTCPLWNHDPDTLPPFGPGPFCGYVRIWDGIDFLVNKMVSKDFSSNQSVAFLYGLTKAGFNVTWITPKILDVGDKYDIGWYYIVDQNCGSPDFANCWGSLPSPTVWDGLVQAISSYRGMSPGVVPEVMPGEPGEALAPAHEQGNNTILDIVELTLKNSGIEYENISISDSGLKIVFPANCSSSLVHKAISVMSNLSLPQFNSISDQDVSGSCTIDLFNKRTVTVSLFMVIFVPSVLGLLFIFLITWLIWYCMTHKKVLGSGNKNVKNEVTSDMILDLPEELLWFFDLNRVQKSYTKVEGELYYYYFIVTPNSKEHSLLQSLQDKLDWGDLRIKTAYALVSPTLVENFSNSRKILKTRMKTNPEKFVSDSWRQNDKKEMRSEVIQFFNDKVNSYSWNQSLSLYDGPILPAVHGTDNKIAWAIATSGFAALSSLDAGFYGKGIYLSSSAQYTLPYFFSQPVPTLLICLTIPGNPYPVVEGAHDSNSFTGKPIVSGYQSHYVVTKIDGTPYKINPKGKKYDELVIDQESRIVPLFVINIDQSNLQELANNFQRSVLKKLDLLY